ncbi:MAG: hypothetical protein ACLQUT_12450 [Thermoleophilia bacterium]
MSGRMDPDPTKRVKSTMRFALYPRPPFRLDTTVLVPRRNAMNAVVLWGAPYVGATSIVGGSAMNDVRGTAA